MNNYFLVYVYFLEVEICNLLRIAFACLLNDSYCFFFVHTIRRQQEAVLKLLEEETARRLEESIRKNVEEMLNSEEVQLEIERRIEEGRKKLFDDVEAQLRKEKEAALAEERRKEVRILNSRYLLVPLLQVGYELPPATCILVFYLQS